MRKKMFDKLMNDSERINDEKINKGSIEKGIRDRSRFIKTSIISVVEFIYEDIDCVIALSIPNRINNEYLIT